MNIDLWLMIPALMITTLFFYVADHMNYTTSQWVIGNGLVAVLIGAVYLIEYVFIRDGGENENTK